jgi:DNA polymerase V
MALRNQTGDGTGTLIGPLPIFGEELVLAIMATPAACGFANQFDQYLDDPIDLLRLIAPNPEASFLWRAAGDSMIEAGIHDGDLLVIDKSLTPMHGDAVVAAIDGQPTVKLYRRTRAGFALAYANAAMPPFRAGDAAEVRLWGVVSCNLHFQLPRRR